MLSGAAPRGLSAVGVSRSGASGRASGRAAGLAAATTVAASAAGCGGAAPSEKRTIP